MRAVSCTPYAIAWTAMVLSVACVLEPPHEDRGDSLRGHEHTAPQEQHAPQEEGHITPPAEGHVGQPDNANNGQPADADPAPTSEPVPLSEQGCADGEREGFRDRAAYPNIAGCSGGFAIPGIHTVDPGTAPACPSIATSDTAVPACGRAAGDDSANPSGAGCNVADLCAPGWHVCASADDVTENAPNGCEGATDSGDPPLFFASRQTSNGCARCATGTATASYCDSRSCRPGCLQTEALSNDVFGCGNFGASLNNLTSCNPLNRYSDNLCDALAGSPWSCEDDGSGLCEAYVVQKSAPSHGGVLCCRDTPFIDEDGDGVSIEDDCDDGDATVGLLLYQNAFRDSTGGDSDEFHTTPALDRPWGYDGNATFAQGPGQQAQLGPTAAGVTSMWTDVAVFATVSSRGVASNCGHEPGQEACTNDERWRAGMLVRAELDHDQGEGYHGYRCALASNARNGCYRDGLFLQLSEFMDAEEDDVNSECNRDCPPDPTFDQHGRQDHNIIDLSAGDEAQIRFYAVGGDMYCEASSVATGDVVWVTGSDDSFASGMVGFSTLNMMAAFDSIRVCQALSLPPLPITLPD